MAGEISDEEIGYFAQRPSVEYDEVVLQADYAARATISFYRFRQLGGGRDNRKAEKKMKFGTSSGRGIHYVSDHPQVRLLNLSVIALLILFESAANAYFFAQQSEFGISGGLFQAAAVSLANVATSYFIIGFWGLRHASIPTDPDKRFWDFDMRNVIKAFGILAILFGVTMVLLVNLSAAHYRNLLDLEATVLGASEAGNLEVLKRNTITFPRFWVDPQVCEDILESEIGQSIGSAATNAMCRPFALHSLDAMVLFALGLAISAFAAFEGRRADSSFPGFSDAARQLEGARRDLQYALEDYYDMYEDWTKDAEDLFGKEFGSHEKIMLRRALDERVEAHRRLLTSDPAVLRDEFDVPHKAVEKITGQTIPAEDRTKAGEDS